jgi:hypothetical protein
MMNWIIDAIVLVMLTWGGIELVKGVLAKREALSEAQIQFNAEEAHHATNSIAVGSALDAVTLGTLGNGAEIEAATEGVGQAIAHAAEVVLNAVSHH